MESATRGKLSMKAGFTVVIFCSFLELAVVRLDTLSKSLWK